MSFAKEQIDSLRVFEFDNYLDFIYLSICFLQGKTIYPFY
jgi:hypothetical protein